MARPRGTATAVARAGVDIVVLQDASASMHVTDVAGGRWAAVDGVRAHGSATRFSWQDDRVALAVFAHIATPQIRLTRDPNTVFFFLDHLGARPPFRLEDDTTWNTDLEQAVAWGLRILEKDEELHGVSPNARVFLMLSDGEAWSGRGGQVDRPGARRAGADLRRRRRHAGRRLAARGGGGAHRGTGAARHLAAEPRVAAAHRRAAPAASTSSSIATPIATSPTRSSTPAAAWRRRKPAEPTVIEYYPRLLMAAIALAGLSLLFARERVEGWLQFGLAVLALGCRHARAGLTAVVAAIRLRPGGAPRAPPCGRG